MRLPPNTLNASPSARPTAPAPPLSKLFRDGGRCEAAAKTDFDAAKWAWLDNFDSHNPYTLTSQLGEIRAAALKYLGQHPSPSEVSDRLWATVEKIDALRDAVADVIIDTKNHPKSFAAVDKALSALEGTCTDDRESDNPYCPGVGDGALEKLGDTLATQSASDKQLTSIRKMLAEVSVAGTEKELDQLRGLQTCRSDRASLKQARASAAAQCNQDDIAGAGSGATQVATEGTVALPLAGLTVVPIAKSNTPVLPPASIDTDHAAGKHPQILIIPTTLIVSKSTSSGAQGSEAPACSVAEACENQ